MPPQIDVERIGSNMRDLLQAHFDHERLANRAHSSLFELSESEIEASREDRDHKTDQQQHAAMESLDEANRSPIPIEHTLLSVLNGVLEWNEWKYRNHRFFLFNNCLYAAIGPYNDDEMKLAICDEADKERCYFDSLSTRHSDNDSMRDIPTRERISERIRVAVWRRDQGKCCRCGSRNRLEFDHIIPIAKGGSNATRNIELLCEKCNRSKGKRIV